MKPLELAHRFLEVFFSGKDLVRLLPLCHDDLQFDGPFYQGNSAKDYIDALIADPPEGMTYRILTEYVNGNDVCVIYQFSKGEISTPMVQRFICEEGKIAKIQLIFDTVPFSG